MAINVPSAARELGPLWKLQLDMLREKDAKRQAGFQGLAQMAVALPQFADKLAEYEDRKDRRVDDKDRRGYEKRKRTRAEGRWDVEDAELDAELEETAKLREHAAWKWGYEKRKHTRDEGRWDIEDAELDAALEEKREEREQAALQREQERLKWEREKERDALWEQLGLDPQVATYAGLTDLKGKPLPREVLARLMRDPAARSLIQSALQNQAVVRRRMNIDDKRTGGLSLAAGIYYPDDEARSSFFGQQVEGLIHGRVSAEERANELVQDLEVSNIWGR